MAEPEAWKWKSIPVAPKGAGGTSALRIVLELAIPLAVAALLFRFGRPITAGVILAIGLSIFTANRVSARARAALERFFARLAFWVGEILTVTMLMPVYYGIITPVAFFLRLRGDDPLDTAVDRERPSYWVDASFPREKRRYFNQFTYERYADPPRRPSNPFVSFVTALLWLVMLNTVVGFGLRAAGVGERPPLDYRSRSEVYAGADWAKPYFRELARTPMDYRPYLGWARKDTPERYEHITVRDRIRRNGQAPPANPVAEVWFFGGSTVWGVGSRDVGTIPAAFERVAAEEGLPVEAVNLGEDAYVQWQEILRLEERLVAGDVPDLAIFYDGGNDVFAYFQDPSAAAEGLPQQNQAARRNRLHGDPSLLRALSDASAGHRIFKALRSLTTADMPPPWKRKWPVAAEGEPPEPSLKDTATLLARRYAAGVAHLEHLSEAYGFDLVVAWQPAVFTKPFQTVEENQLAGAFGDDLPSLYNRARGSLWDAFQTHEDLHDLGDAFDEEKGPVYIDWIHVGEESNEELARGLFDIARPDLEARAAE